jgi:dihydroxy-acid dehydratase
VASVGTCSVMGTASTMACIAEALGMTVPGGASPPAVTADRMRVAEDRRVAVQMARSGLTIDKILTPKAFENAMRVLLAIGGSTNAIVHLTAIAGRMGYDIDLAALDRMGRETPVLLDLKPSGQHYMEDFHAAGGMATLLRELKPLLHLDALTVTGRTLGEELEARRPGFKQDVVRPRSQPDLSAGRHRGAARQPGAGRRDHQAVGGRPEADGARRPRRGVRERWRTWPTRIDSDDLDVTADDVLVLKNIGPKGAPGMPEAGYIPMPRKLARQGVKDMVRISDGRMSGTAFGTIVLHVTPESAIGGPLAYVRNGDRIRCQRGGARSALLVSDAELARRAKEQPVHAADRRARLPQAVPADGDAGRQGRGLRLPGGAGDLGPGPSSRSGLRCP